MCLADHNVDLFGDVVSTRRQCDKPTETMQVKLHKFGKANRIGDVITHMAHLSIEKQKN